MRKLFFLLAFLCCVVTQLKADVIQPATTPYYPEHVYTMMNANGWYANATTHGTQTAAEAGHFAFYPVSGVENAYYIYSVDNNQWLTYTKAASYSNTRNFISMNSSFGIDDYFYLNQRQNGYYDIAPYNNTGIASKYLNWFEGANESHTTIGLWQQNLIDDPGSKFSFTEVTIDSEEIPYFTITSEGRGTWIVSENMTSWYFQTSANLDASNELQHFAFIKKNGNVYLYNKGISKYINKDHNFSDEPTDGITFLYGAAIDNDKESNLNTDNNFVICFDNSHFINLGGDRQIIIDDWGPNSQTNSSGKTDIGNCVTITKQGTFTIKQPEPEPGVEPASEITTGVYEMYNMDTPSRGYLVHSTDYPTKIKLAECNDPNYAGKTYADRFHTSLNSYWYVYQSDKGNTYIFSLANGLFITDEGDQAVTLTATPEPVILENKTDKVFNIKSSKRDYYLDAAVGWGNNTDNIIWVNNNTDGGCPYSFYPATKEVNATMLSTALAAIQNAEKGPDTSADDLSEELAPNFGKVDIEGIKVTPTTGTFSSESYGYYGIWASDSTYSRWIGKNEDADVYEHLPLVTIKTFTGTGKNEGHRFDLGEQTDHTLAFVVSSTDLASMTIEAASGYNIVGYCFDYTAPKDITDNDSYEGEITCTAGTHHVEVKNLDAKDVNIAFGKMLGNITISNFYVFVRRGLQLTYTDLQRFSNLYYIPYAFTLAPYNKPDHHVYAPKDGKWLEACGNDCKKYKEVKVTGRDEAQQFVLIPFDSYYINNYPDYNGLYFLYSVSEKKFVSAQDGKAILTEYPIQAAAIEAGEGDYEGYFRINFNKTNLLNVSTGYCQADDADASCIITFHNGHDGGNHFLLRVARDFSFEPGDKMSQIFIESYYIEDQNLIDEKAAEIQALLDVNGPGSPTDDLRNILIQYLDNVARIKESVAFFGLHRFLPEYKSSTSVKMPETGKAYRIKTYYMGNKGRYLKAAEDGKLTIVNEGQHKADNTTVFVVKSMDTAKDGEGTYAIVGENGQFLVGARTGTQGFVSSYNGTNTGSLQLTTAANKGDYFGGFLLKTTDGTNTYNLQLGTTTNNTEMVITYDAENPGSIINDPNGGSSIFYLEEVNDYPNVVKLREPAVTDGKAYSSIWLPFSVEIPEGVRAYKAHVDYTTNQLVCGEVKNILPGGEGAILISEKAQEIVLAPATADVVPLQDNDLQGTNVTVARNTGVTTFVLNGGKGEIGFYPYTGENIAKYKAYVEVDKAQAAQGLRFSFGTATDIENTLTEGEGEAKEYYDLSGRRVAQPTKGLYIVNGKKMYIK